MKTEEIKEIRRNEGFADNGHAMQNNPHLDIIFEVAFKIGMKQVNNLDLADVISRFLKEAAEKHSIGIESLNLHVDGNDLQVQKYEYGGTPEFQYLESIELNGL